MERLIYEAMKRDELRERRIGICRRYDDERKRKVIERAKKYLKSGLLTQREEEFIRFILLDVEKTA